MAPGAELVNRIVPGRYGPELVLRTAWSEEIENTLREHGIVGLRVVDARLGPERRLDFLRRVPDLRLFSIIDWHIEDISPIQELHNLDQLEITTRCTTKLNFNSFPHLERLSVEWQLGFDGLFSLTTLRHLFINRLPAAKAEDIGNLSQLKSLALLSCGARGLDSLRSLSSLRALRLGLFRRLENNRFLSDMAALSDLWVQSCAGFHDLEPIRGLSNLRHLALDSVGRVSTLEPLSGLACLESVGLYDRTDIVDGRISVLKTLPSLKSIVMRDRRHYDTKSHELPGEAVPAWNEGDN